jgi:hypothetical protein
MTGPDLSTGPPEYDVGWLLGALHEIEFAGRHGFGPFRSDGHAECRAALVRGYPGPLRADLLNRTAAVRVLAHAADFARFHGWNGRELTRYVDLAGEIGDATG